MAERRQYPRLELVTRVTHLHGDDYIYYYSRDLSQGGIFLETRKPFGAGTRLELDFELPGREQRIRVEGEVVRIVEADLNSQDRVTGMGISFTRMSEECVAEIGAWLKEALA